ncbi:MAG: PTS transporter subunit EIIC [Brevinemataceae bacterium]
MMKNNSSFVILQKLGQALMLPVAVLPIAGILLGIGAGVPAALSANGVALPIFWSNIFSVMGTAGDTIFSILPLLFAIAVAIAFTENDGTAALATLVGYVVFLGSIGAIAKIIGTPTKAILNIQSLDLGVVGGLLVGGLSAFIFNRTYNTQLPEFLGFFGGKRFVLIANALACLLLGILMTFIWSPIGKLIESFSNWAAYGNPNIAFPVYGFFERMLLPFGVHHIWNVPFFFEIGSFDKANLAVVQETAAYMAQNASDVLSGVAAPADIVKGEIPRYLSGDPTSGNLAASYLFKMWGLPAAAIAIGLSAKPENRKKVMGMMISAALTSFLTGITEPIEFSFLFVAPALYFIHALLVLLAYIVITPMDIRHGTTFSHGAIDYTLLYGLGENQHLLILFGLLWAVLYFIVFYFAIKIFDFKTPGREDDISSTNQSIDINEIAELLINAYGGLGNISSTDACITRLRITVKDTDQVNEAQLKKLGAKAIIISGNGTQAIFGPKSDIYKNEMIKYMNQHK